MSLGLGTVGGQALATVLSDAGIAPSSQRLGDKYFRPQEQPWHPGSFVWAGVQGPNVQPPDHKTYILTTQEYPLDHPRGFLYAGVQGPNVRVPVTDRIFIAQELPWHPGSFVQPGIQGPNVRPPIRDFVFTRQEYPLDHPTGFVVRGGQFPTPGDYTFVITLH